MTIFRARSRQLHRRPARIDATNTGGVGTINGFAFCVSRIYAKAGDGQ
jgi:hypothetical protein